MAKEAKEEMTKNILHWKNYFRYGVDKIQRVEVASGW